MLVASSSNHVLTLPTVNPYKTSAPMYAISIDPNTIYSVTSPYIVGVSVTGDCDADGAVDSAMSRGLSSFQATQHVPHP